MVVNTSRILDEPLGSFKLICQTPKPQIYCGIDRDEMIDDVITLVMSFPVASYYFFYGKNIRWFRLIDNI